MKAILLATLLLLTTLAFLPAADAKPEEPQCMPVYQRTDLGTVSVVRRDSCHVAIYECPYQGAHISECTRIAGN